MPKKTYAEKLRDPRWQKKRLLVLERDDWTCQACGDTETTLHVHHRYYESGAEPWECDDHALMTLCEECHAVESEGWRTVEQDILRAFKAKFLHDDAAMVAFAIEHMPMVHTPGVLAWALYEGLRDKDALTALVDRYLDGLGSNGDSEG